MNKTLGVLGGLGPMSSVYFYEMLTSHTKASRDQEHLNVIISSRADTPDRTAFILGRSEEDPTPVMLAEVSRLINAGAELIALPCNTAHSFYRQISIASSVPVINIIRQTVKFCFKNRVSKVGVLATEGTVASGAYKTVLDEAGIGYAIPDSEGQEILTDTIYGRIKKGLPPDMDAFYRVCDKLFAEGCERLILGCTELSLIKKEHSLGERYIDSLEVLACSAIKLCGKEVTGFDREICEFVP